MNTRQQLEQAEQHWGNMRVGLRRFWQVVIYATTALGFVSLAGQQPTKLQGWSLVVVVGLVATYLLAFHLILINPRLRLLIPRIAIPYITFQILVLAALTAWTHAFIGLGFALIAQAVSVLPPRLWAYPILVITLLLGQNWGFFDNFPNANWTTLGSFLFDVAIFTGLFVAFELVARQRTQMKALVDQVQQAREAAEALASQNANLASARQQTIGELEATRRDLAAAERAAGVFEERQRLARDIHDTLAQSFTSIVMHLEAAAPDLSAIPAVALHIEQARRSAREGLSEARRLVWALRPEALEQSSLAEALQRLAQSWGAASGVTATATITGSPCSLPTDVEVALLRVAQEALSNVRKHARAGKVTLTLSFMDDMLLLDVQDDGVGFDSGQLAGPNRKGGYGLTIMRERIAQLGGTLTIESAPGEGTTVVVEMTDLPGRV